jgi:hypothetical protein
MADFAYMRTAKECNFTEAFHQISEIQFRVEQEVEPRLIPQRNSKRNPLDLDPSYKLRAHAILFELQELKDRLEEIDQDYTSLRGAAIRQSKKVTA